ncbi:MAG: 4-alpha-glucanotransferase, partial [Duncaniella sp.]|nr:4-alpha-glucanotransferase [Duncaniella sp.]
MKLTFNVDYRTQWGESLFLTGSAKALGEGDLSRSVPMTLTGAEHWSAEVEIPDNVAEFSYSYFVRHDNGEIRREWGKPRSFVHAADAHRILINDRWQDQPWDKPYYSSAFVDCICNRTDRQPRVLPAAGMLTLSVDAPMIHPDQVVAVAGEAKVFGAWDPSKALRMSDACYPTWTVNVPVAAVRPGSDYKFLILNSKTGEVVAWEGRDNRHIDITAKRPETSIVDSGQRLVNPLAPWRGTGVAIPVFSLRSEEDFGVGDFYDLFKMVDWAVQTRQNFIQVLPINDTTMTNTWQDSYPYNANSTFALHPMYLRVQAMGRLSDAARQNHYDNLARELNRLEQIDYEAVNAAKREYTRELYV